MCVGQRIKRLRKRVGMSAETLAEKVGVAPSTIYRYESGDIDKVNSDMLIPIAKALGTTPACLMGWENNASEYVAVTELEMRFISAIRHADAHDIDNALLILEASARGKKTNRA